MIEIRFVGFTPTSRSSWSTFTHHVCPGMHRTAYSPVNHNMLMKRVAQTSKRKTGSSVNISELKVSGKRKADAVEDRYYIKEKYKALSADQKKVLASKRIKRGHRPGAKDSKVTKNAGKKGKAPDAILKAVNRQVSQLAKQMTKAGVADEDDSSINSLFSKDSSSKADDNKKKTGSNRSNAALTRQKKVTISSDK
jgi:hypothetical protein